MAKSNREVTVANSTRKRAWRGYKRAFEQLTSELDYKNAQLRGERANELDPLDERYLEPNYSTRRMKAIEDGYRRGWVRMKTSNHKGVDVREDF